MTKLTYTDLEELRDAGFSFRKADASMPISDMLFTFPMGENTVWVIPILEELIDACGDKFRELIQYEDIWTARAWADVLEYTYKGKTPIQAVKNLYIALNRPTCSYGCCKTTADECKGLNKNEE